jgi:hypothetical protein
MQETMKNPGASPPPHLATYRYISRGGRRVINHSIPPRSATRVHRLVPHLGGFHVRHLSISFCSQSRPSTCLQASTERNL